MAQRFGAGMHGKVLGAGGGLEHFPIALQALHIGNAEAGGQIGILAVGLMAAAPAGITENIDVGRPEGEALVDISVAMGNGSVVLGAALGGGYIAQFLDQLGIKGGGDADGLREAGGHACTGHAVKGFVPPVVSRNTQTIDGRSIKAKLACHLFHCHLRNQRFSLLFRQITIHGENSFHHRRHGKAIHNQPLQACLDSLPTLRVHSSVMMLHNFIQS